MTYSCHNSSWRVNWASAHRVDSPWDLCEEYAAARAIVLSAADN